MKKILTLFLILTNFIVFSQVAPRGCNTSNALIHNADFNRLALAQASASVDLTTPYVLNVHFTLIKNGDATYPFYFQNYLDTPEQIENKFLHCIKMLNIKFNPYNLYFKYTGFQEKRNDLFTYANPFTSASGTYPNGRWNELDEFKEENAINFYFVTALQGDIASETILGGKDVVLDTSILLDGSNYETFLDNYLYHTIGHCLSLYHTYHLGYHYLPDNLLYYSSYAEHVTRDEMNPDYNATYAGDEVTDTPAQPFLSENNFGYNCGVYIGNAQLNHWNETYPSDITRNYMNCLGFGTPPLCNDFNFTSGQIDRMRNYISTNTTNYGYLLGTDSARTDVSALYEPFDAQVIVGEQVSAVDQPENGGAYVCREQLYRLRFQPGFKQVFSNITNGPITQTQDQQFNYTNGFDHGVGVEIPSLSNQILNVGIISSITGLSCGFEPYISGTVYSMEVLGSMNISVKELNEIEAKDPELYNKLMEQYYYILKKITTSGAKTEQTFYKN
jgi:hypothetical protein